MRTEEEFPIINLSKLWMAPRKKRLIEAVRENGADIVFVVYVPKMPVGSIPHHALDQKRGDVIRGGYFLVLHLISQTLQYTHYLAMSLASAIMFIFSVLISLHRPIHDTVTFAAIEKSGTGRFTVVIETIAVIGTIRKRGNYICVHAIRI